MDYRGFSILPGIVALGSLTCAYQALKTCGQMVFGDSSSKKVQVMGEDQKDLEIISKTSQIKKACLWGSAALFLGSLYALSGQSDKIPLDEREIHVFNSSSFEKESAPLLNISSSLASRSVETIRSVWNYLEMPLFLGLTAKLMSVSLIWKSTYLSSFNSGTASPPSTPLKRGTSAFPYTPQKLIEVGAEYVLKTPQKGAQIAEVYVVPFLKNLPKTPQKFFGSVQRLIAYYNSKPLR